jgi:hypothetical protein
MRIRKLRPDGTVSTISGGWFHEFSDGLLNLASFREPTGIAIDRLVTHRCFPFIPYINLYCYLYIVVMVVCMSLIFNIIVSDI